MYRIFIFITFSIMLTGLGCFAPTENELSIQNPKIKAMVEAKREALKEEIMRNCTLTVHEKAVIYVDSLITAQIEFRINDDVIFPEKPQRPEWPGAINVPDTLKAKPIY